MKQTTGLKRVGHEKYYTNTDVAETCCEIWKRYINPSNDDIVIECSAGNGSFLNYLPESCISYDIEPEHPNIMKQDFLELDTTKYNNKNVHIISNPPFGRQSSLAKKFIKKSCTFATSISFILPRSFKKESQQSSFSPHFHLIYEENIKPNAFNVSDESIDIPCVFQIWRKKPSIRIKSVKEDPCGFRFVQKEDGGHICIRRVGWNTGQASNNLSDKSKQSHYFILLDDTYYTNIDAIISSLNTYVYIQMDDVVASRSICKQDVIRSLNGILESLR